MENPNMRPISEAPTDGTEILVAVAYRYQTYKPDGARQMRKSGRWQAMGEFGWENAPAPDYWLAISPMQTK